ncbi:unnamed protein product [Prorocentrum cordatum]|uniref:Cyclic nucleotide-binding domain-containing protein n=1 Tax=Prorocentrum cordatum TaxID=2364126 RepID=A0ABN9R844_9DINO|nr:unnamed protein product [Polarella glacialis]
MSTESRSGKMFTRFASPRSIQHQSVFRHDCLRHCALFKERDPRFLQSLLEELSVEIFHPGEVIMREGDAGDTFYVLNVGKVEVLNGQNVVAVLEGGNSFGEMTLLGVSNVRTCTIRALEFCDCRVISNRSFQRVLQMFSDEKVFFDGLAMERKVDLHRKLSVTSDPSPFRRRRTSAHSPATASKRSLQLAPPLERATAAPSRQAPTHARLSDVSRCFRSFRRRSAPPGLPRPGAAPAHPPGPPRWAELERALGGLRRPGSGAC